MSDLGLRAITNTGVRRMSVSRMSSEFKSLHRPSRRFSKVAGEPRSQSKACDSARTSLPIPLVVLASDDPGFILVSRYQDVNLGIELLTLMQFDVNDSQVGPTLFPPLESMSIPVVPPYPAYRKTSASPADRSPAASLFSQNPSSLLEGNARTSRIAHYTPCPAVVVGSLVCSPKAQLSMIKEGVRWLTGSE